MSDIQGVLQEVTELTERISSFVIGPADGGTLPAWTPGAHVVFKTGDTAREYSLITFDAVQAAPESYRIAVQREPDGKGGSKAMHALKPGDPITLGAPKNDFPVDTSAPAVLLAGGIGVTPLISMAMALKNAGQNFSFHYAGRSEGVMAYREVLAEALGGAFHLHCDDAATALDLDRLIADLGAAHLYVCGPRGMIEAARSKAEAAGVPADMVHYELFEAAEAQSGDTPFEVQINDGSVFTVPPGKTIIEVLEEYDIDVMYDCQRGDCGICQTDVIEGTPDHRDVVLTEAERAAGKVMQICVSRAKSPRLVLDIDGD